jgi:hemolysin III
VGAGSQKGWLIVTTLERFFYEPWSALTHLVAAVATLPGVLLLVSLTRDEPGKMVSLLIYGVSLFVLFLASFLLHGVKASPGLHLWLNRFDHSAIFILIAGTYTPIVYNLFPSSWRLPLLLLIWFLATIGTLYKLTSARIHGFLNVSIYVVLGWGGAVPLLLSLQLAPVLATEGLRLLLAGGLIYSVGFVIYYRRHPDPWPATFGHHEIWHLFVIAGSLTHYLFMLWYVVPALPR